MNSRTLVLLALAAFTWFVLFGVLKSVIGVDSTGDRDIFAGLRWIFAGFVMVALWALLAGLVATSGDLIPAWINVVAVLLLLGSLGAALSTLYLLQGPGPWLRWPLAIPLGAPIVIAAYIVLLYKPGFTALAGHLVAWCFVLGFTIAPWSAVSRRADENQRLLEQHDRQVAAAQAQQKEQERAANLIKVSAMSPDQFMGDWFSLLSPESGVRTEAIAALKTVPRRQSDIQYGLENGLVLYMQLVPELDLKPTPQLCAAAQKFVTTLPKQSLSNIHDSLGGMRWFLANGCGLEESIRALDPAIRQSPDSSERQQLLSDLAALKR